MPSGAVIVRLEDAGILGRHQLRLQQEEDRARGGEEQGDDRGRDERLPERPVEPPGIAFLEPAEAPLDPARQPPRSSCRSSFEQSIGARLSAKKPEKATAPIIAAASSRNNRPVWPAMNMIGTNTAQTTIVVEMIAKPTWRAPLIGGGERRLALLDPVIDVLEHDDRVVDDDADATAPARAGSAG